MNYRKLFIITITIGALFFWASLAGANNDELKIDRLGAVNTLDAGWAITSLIDWTPINCVYNGLVKHKEGSWEVVPDLAESWEISSDGKSVVFHLRKGVQFHKGYGEMTAEDVKFSIERIIAPDSKSTQKKKLKAVDRVNIIDNYTVKLILKETYAPLFSNSLAFQPGKIVSKKAVLEMGREKFARNPIGTGPYEFVVWEPKKYVKLKAFKGYWGKKPKIDKLTFLPILDNATVESALKTGELHIGRISIHNVNAFDKNPSIQVIRKPGLRYMFFGFVHSHPPFDNRKLRKAVRYAINVDEVIEAMFYGYATRAKSCIPPGVLGHWEDAPLRKVDLSKAKQLLKEGGKPDGFKAKMNVKNRDLDKIVAEVIKAQLAKIGVDLQINVMEHGAANDIRIKGNTDSFFDNWTAGTDPEQVVMWFVSNNRWNIAHWNNPTFDKLVADGSKEMNSEKRAEIYRKIQQIMDEEAFMVWLTHGVKMFGAQKNLNLGKVYPNGMLAPWTMSFK